MQTGLEPQFQELFFENLPYKPVEPTAAAKLPITTVRALASCTLVETTRVCLENHFLAENHGL